MSKKKILEEANCVKTVLGGDLNSPSTTDRLTKTEALEIVNLSNAQFGDNVVTACTDIQ